MAAAQALLLMRGLNALLRAEPCPHPLYLVGDIKAAIIAAAPDGYTLQGATAAERAALAKVAVEVAEQLVRMEASGALQRCNVTSVAMVAQAASCCTLLARICEPSAADAARVAATVAVDLGSGRRALQALARADRAGIGEMSSFDAAGDLLDSMQGFVLLARHRDEVPTFFSSVARPEKLLGWLQDAAAVLNRLGSLSGAGARHLMTVICLCQTLFCHERFEHCQAALAQQPELETRVVQLAAHALLQLRIALQLPAERRPVWASWGNSLAAAELLCCDILRPAVQPVLANDSHAGSSSTQRSLLHAAAQLLALAPLECPPAMQPDPLARLLVALAGLMSRAATERSHAALCAPPAGASKAEQLSHQQHTSALQRQLAGELLPALPHMAASLQLLLGDSSDGGGESGTCSCSSNGDGGSAGGSASQQSVDRAQMAVQLCTAWSLCLSVAEQLVAPRPHDDSSSSHSGGGRSSSTSSDSPSPALVELQQWDWHGSTRYGVAPASIASLEDVTAWCEAAAAVLRAVPAAARAAVLVAEQGTRAAPRCMLRNPQAASQEPQAASCSPGVLESRNAAEETPAQLAQRCVGLAVAAACSAVHAVGRMPLKPRMKELAVNGRPQPPAAGSTPTVDAAALQAAQHAVWSLHTAAARLAHWACQPRGSGSNSSGAAEAAEAIGGSHDRDGAANAAALLGSWRALPLLRLLNASLGAARLLQSQLKGRSAPDPDLRYDRCMQAMAAAQWPAVQAITADPAVLGQLSRSPADAADLANSLCIAAGCGPGTLALEPELQRLLAQALRCAPQERRAGAAAVWELLLMAENSPRLASALAVTGGLDLIINWLVHTLARQIPFTCDALVLNMGCFILNAVASVRRAGDAVAASAGGGGAATPTLAAVLQAHAGMQQAFPVDDGVQVCVYRIDGELLSRIAGMLPACVQLAAALMAHWREPDQLAASKLEAAQAAAARSCAFLRCASLGGESGPAARQGGFSQRCSACRVAWYCGTACSHANWRAGHRRLCKALGAARQAEKEQRRQAGQPPAG